MNYFIGLAIPITTAITVYLPPTKEKVCVLEYKSLAVKKSDCKFIEYEIIDYPMKLTGGGEEKLYQCIHKYKCEIRR